jgi:hypothetical protein
VKSDKHYKASRSTKGKAWRWPCDVVFTTTSSEEGHNICKTAMPASVPAIGFGCSRSLCPCLRKSLCVDKLGIDIYHIDMTMFCFPWYPQKRTNFSSETSKCRTSAMCPSPAMSHANQDLLVAIGCLNVAGDFGLPAIHGDDPIPEHRASVHSLIHFTEPLIVGKALFPVMSLPVCKGVSITTPAQGGPHELR